MTSENALDEESPCNISDYLSNNSMMTANRRLTKMDIIRMTLDQSSRLDTKEGTLKKYSPAMLKGWQVREV